MAIYRIFKAGEKYDKAELVTSEGTLFRSRSAGVRKAKPVDGSQWDLVAEPLIMEELAALYVNNDNLERANAGLLASNLDLRRQLLDATSSTPTKEPDTIPTPPTVSTTPEVQPTTPEVKFKPDPATGPPNGINYHGPLTVLTEMAGPDGVIRISDHFRSDNPNVSAVIINTDRPVEFTGSIICHAGDGIHGGGSCNLKLRNVALYGTKPQVDNLTRGNSVYAWNAVNVDIENITQESAGGMLFQEWRGNHTPSQSLRIRNVKSRNVIGGNGLGGDQAKYRHLLQLLNVRTKGMLLENIEGYNEPDKSRIEDTINFYNSGGLDAANPLIGNNFYLHGSYPFPATDDRFTGAALSADGNGNPAETSSHIRLRNVFAVSNCNAAFNIATGFDIEYADLWAVTSGLLPDNRKLRASYAGSYIGDFYKTGNMAGNRIMNLTTGFVRTKDATERLDISPKTTAGITGVTLLPDPVTLDTELARWVAWQAYKAKNNITVGARLTK